MQSRRSVHWIMMFFTKNGCRIFYGDLLFDFKLYGRGPCSIWKSAVYWCLCSPCVIEQHSISVFNSTFEKEGEKKFVGFFRSFCFFFCMLEISLWKLELYWTKLVYGSSMNSTIWILSHLVCWRTHLSICITFRNDSFCISCFGRCSFVHVYTPRGHLLFSCFLNKSSCLD